MAITDGGFTDVFGPATDPVITIDTPGYYCINSGSYTSLTVNADVDAGTEIVVSPGVTITGTQDLLGDRTTVHAGPGFTVNGLTTVSGARCSVLGSGSGTMGGVLVNSGANYFCLNGAGKGFLVDGGSSSHAINIIANDFQIRNLSINTNNSSTYTGILTGGSVTRGIINKVKIVNSDDEGVNIAGDDIILTKCHFLAHGGYVVLTGTGSVRNIISKCINSDTSGNGIYLRGDNEIVSNIINQGLSGTNGTRLDGSNSICAGDRLAISAANNGVNNHIANNKVAAFT